jgi:uncharacterized protein (DUF924 family)
VNMPMIRLEVEGMKHTIMAALLDSKAQIDADIAAAVEAYCTDENISRVMREAVSSAMDRVLKDEVRSFFQYGAGRATVRRAIADSLSHDDEEVTP